MKPVQFFWIEGRGLILQLPEGSNLKLGEKLKLEVTVVGIERSDSSRSVGLVVSRPSVIEETKQS